MSQTSSTQDNTLRIRVPATLFCVLTPLVVATRFWSRRQAKSALASDDWTILGSLVFELADCSVLLAACSYGFGMHSASLTTSNKTVALKLFYCSQILYKISLNLTKVSILLLYLRAFTLRPFRIACWILMTVVTAYGIAVTIATILQCAPVARAWDKTVPGTCFDIIAFWYANAIYTIATDLILLVLPMRVIWGLQLRKVQKVAVLVVFAMGGLVTIFSIIRTTTLVASATSNDPTYNIESTSWANIEANVAILCACLPIFRRPLALLFPRILSALGDHPPPASPRKYHEHFQIKGDPNQWVGDGSKINMTPYKYTGPTDTDKIDVRQGGYTDFVPEHIENINDGLV